MAMSFVIEELHYMGLYHIQKPGFKLLVTVFETKQGQFLHVCGKAAVLSFTRDPAF